MNRDLAEKGRRLERQVAGLMSLLERIESELGGVADSPVAIAAGRELAARRAQLIETIHQVEQGQFELESQLEKHVSRLVAREAALEQSRAELRSLTRRLVQVQEDERRALARDLHDTSGQALAVIGLGLAVLKREGGCNDRILGRIEDLQRAAANLGEELHRLSANLRPSSLDRYGLVPAAEELIAALPKQAEIEVEFRVDGLAGRLPDDVETALYRIIQEACTNIVRYASASHVSVRIVQQPDAVRVTVEDDGRGFAVAEALNRGGLGLMGIRERAEMLGGAFTLDSAPGRGTKLTVEAPVVAGVPVEGRVAEVSGPRETSSISPQDTGGEDDSRLLSPVPSAAAELARAKTLSEDFIAVTAGIAGYSNPHDLLAFVLARSAEAVGCDYAVIGLCRGTRWTISHSFRLPAALIGQPLLPAALPLAYEIQRTRKSVVVNDTRSGEPLAQAARELGVLAGAGIPLVAAGRFLGAVAFVRTTRSVPFKPSEVMFLEHLSGLISLAVENIRLRRQERVTPVLVRRRVTSNGIRTTDRPPSVR